MPDWPGTPVQKDQPQWPGTPVQKEQGFMDKARQGDYGYYPKRYLEETASDLGEMKEGAQKFKEGSYLRGGLQAGLGAMNYAFAPVSAGVHTVVGRPVESMTGSKYAGQAADIAGQSVLPFPLGLRGTPAAVKATTAGQVATKLIAPEVLDEISGKAAALIRSESGAAAQETAKTAERLKAFDPVRNSLDEHSRIDLIDRMQNPNAPRSSQVSNVTHYEAELNNIFKDYESRLSALPKGAQMRFRDYYFPNKWEKDPTGKLLTPSGAGSAREGSGRFLKEQSMTLKEGLQKGYVPITTDPTKAAMIYAENVDKFIATEKIFDKAVRDRTIGYFRSGGKFTGPPQGWVKVNGRLGEKFHGMWQAYAPENWARIYNNYVSKGLESTQAADIYSAFQKIENNMIMMKLGLSGYHATMETLYEGPASEFARGITELASGNIRRGAKAVLGSPFAAGKQYVAGRSLERAYLGDLSKRGQFFNYTGLSPEAKASLKEIADLYAKGGGRAVGGRMHSLGEYAMSRQGTYFQPSIRRYTDAFRQASNKMDALMQPSKDALHAVVRFGKEIWAEPWRQHPAISFAKQIGRAMDTIAYPLFEKYIPRLKNGAFAEQMAGWLIANPSATQEMKLAAARKIIDSVDNRFGEMIKDNLFMSRTLKQSLQLATVSYSYEMGTIRELGGAALEALQPGKGGLSMKNPNWTPKQSYALALPVVSGTLAAMYQYMKTGKPPETAMDLVAPRTGGVNERGEPARVTPIGYSKDLYNFMTDPKAWAAGKASPLLETAGEIKSGKDWRGDPIVPVDQTGRAPTYEAIAAWTKHVAEAYVPIAAETMFGGKDPDANISLPEKLMGARSAGMKYTNPEGLDQFLRDKAVREQQEAEIHRGERMRPRGKFRRLLGHAQ